MNARLDLDPIASRRHLPPLTPLGRPNGQNRRHKQHFGHKTGLAMMTLVLGFLIGLVIVMLTA
jgi:hypothetical protein